MSILEFQHNRHVQSGFVAPSTLAERQIQKGLAEVLRGRTSFVIAHRLSTIRSADQILVIDKGKVIEQGTHHELLKKKARYHELYTEQSMRDIVRMD